MPAMKPKRKAPGPIANPDRLRGIRLVCIQAAASLYQGHGVDAPIEEITVLADEMYHWVISPELPEGTPIQYTSRPVPNEA